MKSKHIPRDPLVGPQLELDHWVYHSGFYDGPITGMVKLTDERQVWAAMAEECDCQPDCGFYRRYQLYVLAPFAAMQEAERHADFRRWVGGNADYYEEDGRFRRNTFLTNHEKLWHRYYDKWSWRDAERRHAGMLVNSQLIGWFEW